MGVCSKCLGCNFAPSSLVGTPQDAVTSVERIGRYGSSAVLTPGKEIAEAPAELSEKPAGTIRITATEYAADSILLPKLAKLLPQYPGIRVEIIVDYGLTDIVAQRYDHGVRWGEQVAKDISGEATRASPSPGTREHAVGFSL